MASAKVPAKRAPALGEHNAEVLEQLGFSASEIDALHASGAVPKAKEPARAAAGLGCSPTTNAESIGGHSGI